MVLPEFDVAPRHLPIVERRAPWREEFGASPRRPARLPPIAPPSAYLERSFSSIGSPAFFHAAKPPAM